MASFIIISIKYLRQLVNRFPAASLDASRKGVSFSRSFDLRLLDRACAKAATRLLAVV